MIDTPLNAPDGLDPDALLAWVQQGIVGHDAVVEGPFGPRPLRYFDYTATARAFAPIEQLIHERVLPLLANTHSESSTTGRIMNQWFEQAHRRVARALHAGDDDVVIFTGAGSTAAINHLVYAMGLRLPDDEGPAAAAVAALDPAQRPVVFTSLMEHHSNDLAWRETVAEIVHIGFDADGQVDLGELERRLGEYASRPLKIGTFTLASNVTGTLTDAVGIAQVLHRHNALAFFDAAAAAPYIDIDMHPEVAGGHMDALFLSPHKFLGGPQTPGLLVAHRRLFVNRVPVHPGGGTVLWVYEGGQRYVPGIQQREEGGTPPIVGVIRAGLAFDLKALIGVARIRAREELLLGRAIGRWRDLPGVRLLGNLELPRIGILSVNVEGLHHNLAVRLLSDLYGIQARGGCMCAGPYGHVLLGIDAAASARMRGQIDAGHVGEKPGWVRFGLGPATPEADFAALLDAVEELSRCWPQHLGRYELDDATGEFHLRGGDPPVAELLLRPPVPPTATTG